MEEAHHLRTTEGGVEVIKQKELNMHTHVGRQCTGFSYMFQTEDGKMLKAEFSAIDYPSGKPKEWRMQVVIERTRDADSQVYNFGYVMPRAGLPLELIAATGLKYFQLYLKEEVQMKSNIDMTLGPILEGM